MLLILVAHTTVILDTLHWELICNSLFEIAFRLSFPRHKLSFQKHGLYSWKIYTQLAVKACLKVLILLSSPDDIAVALTVVYHLAHVQILLTESLFWIFGKNL